MRCCGADGVGTAPQGLTRTDESALFFKAYATAITLDVYA